MAAAIHCVKTQFEFLRLYRPPPIQAFFMLIIMIDIANEEAGQDIINQQKGFEQQVKDTVFVLRDCIEDGLFDKDTIIVVTPLGYQIVNKKDTMNVLYDEYPE